MGYRVVSRFTDRVTGNVYEKDQFYPEHDADRIKELSGRSNSQKKPLIKKVDAAAPIDTSGDPHAGNELKHVGGGYYELSNGERVRGKEEAQAAENELRG